MSGRSEALRVCRLKVSALCVQGVWHSFCGRPQRRGTELSESHAHAALCGTTRGGGDATVHVSG